MATPTAPDGAVQTLFGTALDGGAPAGAALDVAASTMPSDSAPQREGCLPVFASRLGPDGVGRIPCADSVVCAMADLLLDLERERDGACCAGSESEARAALGAMLLALQWHADDGRVFAAGCCVVYRLLTMYRLASALAQVAVETILHVQREREAAAHEPHEAVAPVCAFYVLHTAIYELGAASTESQLAHARRVYASAYKFAPEGSLTRALAYKCLAASAGGLPRVSGPPAHATVSAEQAAAAAAVAAERAEELAAADKAAEAACAAQDALLRVAKPLMAALNAAVSAVERGLLEVSAPPSAKPSAASRPLASDMLTREEHKALVAASRRQQREAEELKAVRKAAAEAKAKAEAAADEAEAAKAAADAAAADAAAKAEAAAEAEAAAAEALAKSRAALLAADEGMTGADAAEPGAEPRTVLH